MVRTWYTLLAKCKLLQPSAMHSKGKILDRRVYVKSILWALSWPLLEYLILSNYVIKNFIILIIIKEKNKQKKTYYSCQSLNLLCWVLKICYWVNSDKKKSEIKCFTFRSLGICIICIYYTIMYTYIVVLVLTMSLIFLFCFCMCGE